MSGSSTDSTTETSRRGLLGRILGVGVLLGAGAAAVFGWQYVTRPEVANFDSQRREDAPNVYTVTVRNNGGPGAVLVILRLFGENDDVVERREREVSMDGRTSRQLEFEVDAPSSVDRFQFEVDPLDFPERIVN